MNQLLLTSFLRGAVMIGSGIVVGKGWATGDEVNSAVDSITTIGSAAIGLGTLAYSVYTRTTAKQIKMTNSLPKVVSPAVAKK